MGAGAAVGIRLGNDVLPLPADEHELLGMLAGCDLRRQQAERARDQLIVEAARRGIRQQAIAEHAGVSRQRVSQIVRRT